MFIFNPDPFVLPTYRLSPFTTNSIAFNKKLPTDNCAIDYFNNRFCNRKWYYTVNGREAINLALQNYNLEKDDLITILTTSDNFYISSCVTKEIETFCKWNREILPETKVIFVNHEFGYPYPNMDKLVESGLPIIEDCCTTFFSQDDSSKIGSYGDFALYSFPKFFPIQIGGLLVSNIEKNNKKSSIISKEQIKYVENTISFYVRDLQELLAKRQINFNYALSLYKEYGFEERFSNNSNIVPSVLLLKNNFLIKDLPSLKIHLNNHGVLSSVFYGEDCFFIPSHQNMVKSDIDYIFESIINFKNELS